MHKKCLAKKGLALVAIVLFIGMSVTPGAGDTETEKYADATSFGVLNNDPFCIPVFFGQKGNNNWFITSLIIYFQYRVGWVEYIWYSITEDSGTDWKEYKEPFLYEEEGIFNFQYKYQDITGNVTYGGQAITLKIDMTPPTIELVKKVKILSKKIIFTANVQDATSGVARVEFYLDGVLKENLTSAPYIYTYTWKKGEDPEEYEVKAIVYDWAGHSDIDNSSTAPVSYPHHATVVSKILQRMHSINQLCLQIPKIMVRFPFHQ